MKIIVPPAARLQQIEAFSRRIQDASTEDFELHLPNTYFSLHPMVLSAIVAGGLRAIAAGKSVTVPNVPDSPSGRYLQRMGLFDLIGVPFTGSVTSREETGRFVPLRVISTGIELSKFVNDLVPLFHTNPDRAQSIQYVVSELMRNVLEHSGGNSKGVVCAQLYPSGVVAIGVADTGQGIRKSLARSYATDSDLHALQLAMRPGVTGTTPNIGGNMDNAGAGLFFCKALAFFSKNYFVMHSGTALFKLRIPRPQDRMALWADAARDRATRYDSMNAWPGTLIGIDLNTEDTRPFFELLKVIREEYGVDVRRERADSAKRRPRFT